MAQALQYFPIALQVALRRQQYQASENEGAASEANRTEVGIRTSHA